MSKRNLTVCSHVTQKVTVSLAVTSEKLSAKLSSRMRMPIFFGGVVEIWVK